MRRRLSGLALVLALLSAACGDGIVGRDTCQGESCEMRRADAGNLLSIEFPTSEEPEFEPLVLERPTRSIGCAGPSCEPAPKLVRAAGDAVWLLPDQSRPTVVRRVGGDWTSSPEVPIEPPAGAQGNLPTFMSGDTAGRVVLRFDWPSAGANQRQSPLKSELVVASEEAGIVERVVLPSDLPLTGAISAPPMGYLLFSGTSYGAGSLVLVGHDGMILWRKQSFLSGARVVGSAAAALAQGFIVSAHSGVENTNPSFGLLWLDAGGRPTRYALPADSSWKSVSLLALDAGAFATAATSDLFGAVGQAEEGNLEIVRFASSGRAVGVRIVRNCYYRMTVHGFTSDTAGNLYVSTVAGEHGAPRGVLCQISPSHALRCFQTEEHVEIGDIVATDERTLFVVVDGEISRWRLPEPE